MTSEPPAWLRWRFWVPVVGAALLFRYVIWYTFWGIVPGNSAVWPEGWWGWWDQGRTLASTVALAHGDLDPARHYYPFGYSLLGVPFAAISPNHPFAVVDLAALLLAFGGFVAFCRRLGMTPAVGAALFALPMLHISLFSQWVFPWNTTPTAAMTWWVLALAAGWLDGDRRPWRIGLLLGGIAACRPFDAAIVAAGLIVPAIEDARRGAWRWRSWAALAGGALIVVVPCAALFLAIHGTRAGTYLELSRRYGFSAHAFGWKAAVLWVDPRPWFGEGRGILAALPWVSFGLLGIGPALFRDARDRMLALTIALHCAAYTAYVDLLPTGLWRYSNIHYFLWTMPGFAALAWRLIGDLRVPGPFRRRAAALAACGALALCPRPDPVPAAPGRPARAADFAGDAPFDVFHDRQLTLEDGRGDLETWPATRVFSLPGRVRAIGIARDLAPPVRWLPGYAPPGFDADAPSQYLAARWRLGWPAWLPGFAGRR